MLQYKRTRILKEEVFWDVVQEFQDRGLKLTKMEKTLNLGSGYMRSVKSRKRMPKFSTYKAITDYLRNLQRTSKHVYGEIITSDMMKFVLDPLYLDSILQERNLSGYALSNYAKSESNALAENIRYWKDKDKLGMSLASLYKFEKIISQYDEDKLKEEIQPGFEKKWDFEKERQHFLKTGELILE